MEALLKDKNAVICGSTQGIGLAIAEGMAESGANVTLVARNQESLKKVQSGLKREDGQVHDYIVADFNDLDAVGEAMRHYAENKDVQILVNNTGGPKGGPITEAGTDEFVKAFSNHLLCNQVITQSLLEGMKRSGYGRIINIISTSVKVPINGLGVSNTTRGAVASWGKTMANELGQYGITVNNILPGMTDTQRLSDLIKAKADQQGITIEEVTTKMIEEIPMGRFATPEEIAHAVIFLASPLASYINGINVPIDGGRTGSL